MDEGKLYQVNHHVLKLNYENSRGVVYGWYWEVYSVDITGAWLIKLVGRQGTKSVEINWFESEELNLLDAVKKRCEEEMRKA